MNIRIHQSSQSRDAAWLRVKEPGFTMIEVAICLGVIAFALVAIVAVLPRALQTQRDNRGNTIIGQEGSYWMEAIRSGSRGLDELTNFVESITISNIVGEFVYTMGNGFTNGHDIIGLLSTDTEPTFPPTKAVVTALSDAAIYRGQASREFGFRYQLAVEVLEPKETVSIESIASMREVVLTFRWPVSNGRVGNQVRVIRSHVFGTPTNEAPGSQFSFFGQ